MAVTYNGLWKLLIDKGMNKTELRQKTGIGTATLAKLSANENVSLDVLEKICALLGCDFTDIIRYVPNAENEALTARVYKAGPDGMIDVEERV